MVTKSKYRMRIISDRGYGAISGSGDSFQNLNSYANKRGLTNLIQSHEAIFEKPITPFPAHPLGVVQRPISDHVLIKQQ